MSNNTNDHPERKPGEVFLGYFLKGIDDYILRQGIGVIDGERELVWYPSFTSIECKLIYDIKQLRLYKLLNSTH